MLAKYLLSDGDSSLVHSPYLELLKSPGGPTLLLPRCSAAAALRHLRLFLLEEENPDQVQGLKNLQHDPNFLRAPLLPLHHLEFFNVYLELKVFRLTKIFCPRALKSLFGYFRSNSEPLRASKSLQEPSRAVKSLQEPLSLRDLESP